MTIGLDQIVPWLRYFLGYPPASSFADPQIQGSMTRNPEQHIREVTDPRAPVQEQLPTAEEYFRGQYQREAQGEEKHRQNVERAFGPTQGRQLAPTPVRQQRI